MISFHSMTAHVSIILPTFNREHFLRGAFASIQSQEFSDWELIIVDDGSSDHTSAMVADLSRETKQVVRYIYQNNQGASGARNTGLAEAKGRYIAFFDSDDEWLPHHLHRCVQVLDSNADVDWVYGACRVVDDRAASVIAESTFYSDGLPRPFLNLTVQHRGDLRVIDDPHAIDCAISSGLMCGLQCSVLRTEPLRKLRIPPFRIGEDQVLTLSYLHRGYRLAYLDAVHAIYHVHDANTAGAQGFAEPEKAALVLNELISALESLTHERWSPLCTSKSLRKRLNREYFWHLGYAALWNHGRQKEAIAAFRSGLRHWPWDWRCWKTFTLAQLKYLCSG